MMGKILGKVKQSLHSRWLAPIYLSLFSILFTFYFLPRPTMNWDVIAYVASAKAITEDDPVRLHRDVYERLNQSVPEKTYHLLTTGKIGSVAVKDPESLWQHLPFYQIRVIYTGTIFLLDQMGINPFFASHLISVLSIILAIWLLAYLWPNSKDWKYIILIPIIAGAANFPGLARLSTPDALAALTVILLFWLLYRKKIIILAVIPLSILVRTDLIILAFLFYAYLFWHRDLKFKKLAISAIFTVIIYLSANAYFGNYGWCKLFHYSFIEKSNYPENYPHVTDISSYLYILISRIPSLLMDGYFPAFVVVTFLGLYILYKVPKTQNDFLSVRYSDVYFTLFASFLYVIFHFLLFPTIWFRFFSAQYGLNMIILVSLIILQGKQMNGLWKQDPDLKI